MSILALMPALDEVGGIQQSGRLAHEALMNAGAYQALQYAPGESRWQKISGQWRAIRSARAARAAETVLVWHLGLAKLIPFLPRGRTRVICFLHGVEAWRKLDAITQSILQRAVNCFLTNSSFTWRRFVEFNPSLSDVPHIVVPLGLGSSITQQSEPVTNAGVIIGRLAETERYKGHEELVAVWPSVRTELPDAVLTVVGDGNMRARLERGVASPGVQFVGSVSDERKQEILLRSRALLMPSRGEGFGLVYVEAMRLGRPCLVSTCDGGCEVVNPPECGLAVNPTDRKELVRAIVRLLTGGPEWARWSQDARKRYESLYTAAHYQDRLRCALEAAARF